MSLSTRLCVLGATAVAAAALPPLAFTSGSATAAEVLLSLGRPATASSAASTALTAGLAVDGSTQTRWASREGVDAQWIKVDLGQESTVSHVRLNWQAAYAASYSVQTSTNGSTWTTIYATQAGNGGVDDLTTLSGKGRYVRLYVPRRATVRGYSLRELQIFGTRPSSAASPTQVDLTDARKKDIAMQLVSSAENSSLDWRAQYAYIEDIGDGRGYTGGIIGFCSGTGDMLAVVQSYTAAAPTNPLAKYLPALRAVNGTASHAGLDPGFAAAWRAAATDPKFQQAQDAERDRTYFTPAVRQAKQDGLHALGQFSYYDAMVMHGGGDDPASFGSIRKAAMAKARTPAQGGTETAYLNAFLDARTAAMRTEEAHSDTSRVDTAQRVFLRNGNLGLNTPLSWSVYGDPYTITR